MRVAAPPSPKPTAGTAARAGDALPPSRGCRSPAAPKPGSGTAVADGVGRRPRTTALVGAALPPGTGVAVEEDHAAAKAFLRAQIATYEASQQKTPASPTEPAGAPELPPTPVTDSPSGNVEAEAPSMEAAARIVAAPSVSPRRDWAKKRWNPASPTKQNAPGRRRPARGSGPSAAGIRPRPTHPRTRPRMKRRRRPPVQGNGPRTGGTPLRLPRSPRPATRPDDGAAGRRRRNHQKS